MANYYRRYVGDFNRDTSHLSQAQIGAYTLMMDWCYAKEAPLPLDFNACCRIARASTEDEIQNVRKILSEFFTKGRRGYTQGRIVREIPKIRACITAAQQNGKMGGRPLKQKAEKPSGFQKEKPSKNPAGLLSNLQYPILESFSSLISVHLGGLETVGNSDATKFFFWKSLGFSKVGLEIGLAV